ncbi:hypothetical protein D3C72_1894280 [compost metagenome]
MHARLAMRACVAAEDERDQAEQQRERPFRQAAVQLGGEGKRVALIDRIIGVRIEKIGKVAILGADRRFARRPRHVGEIEGVGIELDDRHAAVRQLALNLAVLHHQRRAFLVHGTFARIIDELESRVA